eukprot:8592252-Pyramimonas_sp.AAC.1
MRRTTWGVPRSLRRHSVPVATLPGRCRDPPLVVLPPTCPPCQLGPRRQLRGPTACGSVGKVPTVIPWE